MFEILTKEERILKEEKIIKSGYIIKPGFVMKPGQLKKAGDYLLGPILGSSPVKSMVQCLGRKKNTDEFYTLKILTVRENDETQDDRQGKMLLHTEHSLLAFLDGYPGILKQYGLFQDYACDAETKPDDRSAISNGKLVRRLCLVLDCVYPHEYDPYSANYINLQHYVISKRKLAELDAFTIFYNIVSVVNRLHELNIIHKDIKLANLVLNQRTRQITLINFCLGQHLVSENDRLQDQRGSPAYISPEVLIGKPYLGKPSDMWALGVVLFTMLFGQFPFYHKFHQELFKMIKTANYTFPSDAGVKSDTLDIIRGLLLLDPKKRLTSNQVLGKLSSIITARLSPENFPSYDLQIVPNCVVSIKDKNLKTNRKLKNENDIINHEPNDLDYYINKTPFSCETLSQEKKLPGFMSCSLSNKNIPVTLNPTPHNSRSNNSISIIEGDNRNFTQVDLYLHRNLFPRYSGPELMRWQSKDRSSASGSHSSNTIGRSVRAGQSNANRMAGSSGASPVSSDDIPPMNSTQNMYEFPPARRLALALLQQLNNYPDNKPPTVPQLDSRSDVAVASTSRSNAASYSGEIVSAINSKSSDDVSSQSHSLSSNSSQKRKYVSSNGIQCAKFSKVCNKMSKNSSHASCLTLQRMNKNLGKFLSKSPIFLRFCSEGSNNSTSPTNIEDSTGSSQGPNHLNTSQNNSNNLGEEHNSQTEMAQPSEVSFSGQNRTNFNILDIGEVGNNDQMSTLTHRNDQSSRSSSNDENCSSDGSNL